MKLLIAEKPSVAIASYKPLLESLELEKFEKKDGYLKGKGWCITWCIGHLIEMAYPEQSWDLSILPIIPEQWKYKIKEDTKDQYSTIEKLLDQATLVVNGADAGREGELIYRRVLEQVRKTKIPQKRLWLNSFAMKDMVRAWQGLEDIDQYNSLYKSADCRAKSDWLVGMNYSRLYSGKAGVKGISVGRVQTPTLGMIVKRDKEVENWKESYFYQLKAKWKEVEFRYYKDGEKDFESPGVCMEVKKVCENKEGRLIQKDVHDHKEHPSKPLDLAGLQKVCSKKLNLKANDTLKVAQSLYERKLISYPRTDSEYIPDNMKDEAYQIAKDLATDTEASVMRNGNESFVFVNSKKVTDHYAIIPTGQKESEVSDLEKKVYEIIRKRFIMAFGKPYISKKMDLLLNCQGHEFRAQVIKDIDLGYKKIESENKESELVFEAFDRLSSIEEGEESKLYDVEIDKKKRTPPKYFTEGTLIGAMETAGRKVDNEEIKEVMKGQGLGTPATRASIIEKLKKREYISGKGRYIVSTSKGRQLIDVVHEEISNPELTGQWELKLKKIENSQYDPERFLQEIQDDVCKQVEHLKSDSRTFDISESGLNIKCPNCNGEMRVNNGGFFCRNDESCDTKIFRKIAGKKLSDKVLMDLITKGSTRKLKGFKSKKGSSFDAALIWKDGKVTFNFGQ